MHRISATSIREAGVIMEEQAGWRVAQHIGLPVIGTAGILIPPKYNNLAPAVRPQLDAWADSEHFLDRQLRETILYLAGEA